MRPPKGSHFFVSRTIYGQIWSNFHIGRKRKLQVIENQLLANLVVPRAGVLLPLTISNIANCKLLRKLQVGRTISKIISLRFVSDMESNTVPSLSHGTLRQEVQTVQSRQVGRLGHWGQLKRAGHYGTLQTAHIVDLLLLDRALFITSSRKAGGTSCFSGKMRILPSLIRISPILGSTAALIRAGFTSTGGTARK